MQRERTRIMEQLQLDRQHLTFAGEVNQERVAFRSGITDKRFVFAMNTRGLLSEGGARLVTTRDIPRVDKASFLE